jgi:hypothetical protein
VVPTWLLACCCTSFSLKNSGTTMLIYFGKANGAPSIQLNVDALLS